MLPNNLSAREEYTEMREFRNRMRDMQMRAISGDIDTFTDYLAKMLSIDANIASFRENIDFLEQTEQLLTDEMKHAARNMVSWGEELIRMIKERK